MTMRNTPEASQNLDHKKNEKSPTLADKVFHRQPTKNDSTAEETSPIDRLRADAESTSQKGDQTGKAQGKTETDKANDPKQKQLEDLKKPLATCEKDFKQAAAAISKIYEPLVAQGLNFNLPLTNGDKKAAQEKAMATSAEALKSAAPETLSKAMGDRIAALNLYSDYLKDAARRIDAFIDTGDIPAKLANDHKLKDQLNDFNKLAATADQDLKNVGQSLAKADSPEADKSALTTQALDQPATNTERTTSAKDAPLAPPPLPEPSKEGRQEIRSGEKLTDAEKSDGVFYSYDIQFPGSTHTAKYGHNKDGKFVRMDTANGVYRNLDASQLSQMHLANQPVGWYLMGKDGPQKIRYDDIRFIPPNGKGDSGILISQQSETTAYAFEANGTKHEGTINALHAFVESDKWGNPIWMVRPDGSQVHAECDFSQVKTGPDQPLKSLTEITAQGDRSTFTQDEFARNKMVKRDTNGQPVEERFYVGLNKNGVLHWDDKSQVSTIVLGDSTVEHGHILFGESNTATQFRHNRKLQKEDKQHLQPQTVPTFCLDSQGRVSAILAPEKGGRPGCNDSTGGGTDRLFSYIGNTDKLDDFVEIQNKGPYADRGYHTTRNKDAYGNWTNSWTVQNPVQVEQKQYKLDKQGRPELDDEHKPITETVKVPSYTSLAYNGPMQFEPGTLNLRWDQPVGSTNKFNAACINRPDGTTDIVHKRDYKENDRPLYSVNRYLDKNTLKVIGVEHLNANGKPVGERYTETTHPGALFNEAGNVQFTDKDGKQHQISPDHSQLVLNPGDRTYVQTNSHGEVVRSGPLIRTSQFDPTGKPDGNNGFIFHHNDPNNVEVTKVVDQVATPYYSGIGLVNPAGNLLYQKDGKIVMERPDGISMTKEPDPDGRSNGTLKFSFSNAETDITREFPDRQEQPAVIDLGTITQKESKEAIETKLVAMDRNEAVKYGLPPAEFPQYYLTQTATAPGEQSESIVPPPTPTKPGERPTPPQVFINVEPLKNGDVQATSVTFDPNNGAAVTKQILFRMPKTLPEMAAIPIPDTIHRDTSRAKFDAIIDKADAQGRPQFPILSPEQMNAIDHNNPRWRENWAAIYRNISIYPPIGPGMAAPQLSPEQLAFRYDCAIAEMLAKQGPTQTFQPIPMPRSTEPDARRNGDFNKAFDEIRQRRQQKKQQAAPSDTTGKPRSGEGAKSAQPAGPDQPPTPPAPGPQSQSDQPTPNSDTPSNIGYGIGQLLRLFGPR